MDDARDVSRDIRDQRNACGVDGLIAEVADRQHGVISHQQLVALGLGKDSIHRRAVAGRLLPLHRCVYAVGHRNRSRESAWMAAVLASGEGAVLSHRSAAALWGISRYEGRPEVTVPSQRRAKSGIVLHRSTVAQDERTVHEGIPVTTVPRTIFDMAPTSDERQLERIINEAEIRRLWDELSLHDLLRRYPRRPGAATARAALQKRREGPTPTKSDLEELFIAFADRTGLPRPETNAYVEGLEVDCVWRQQRVIIEVDSWEFHRTRAAFERDREKSRILQAAGWRCVAVTHRQLEHGADALARDVRRLLAAATLAA
jgi:very-short-patch-repair endonuclease